MFFTDDKGRAHEVKLTIGALRRVRDRTGYNLFRMDETDDKGRELLQRFYVDGLVFGEICGVLFLDSLKGYAIIKDEEIDEWLTDNLAGLRKEVTEALTDFFQSGGYQATAELLKLTLPETETDSARSTSLQESAVLTPAS